MLSQTYPQGGDSVTFRAPSPRDCQRKFSSFFFTPIKILTLYYIEWIQEINYAGKRARRAEERGIRKLRQ